MEANICNYLLFLLLSRNRRKTWKTRTVCIVHYNFWPISAFSSKAAFFLSKSLGGLSKLLLKKKKKTFLKQKYIWFLGSVFGHRFGMLLGCYSGGTYVGRTYNYAHVCYNEHVTQCNYCTQVGLIIVSDNENSFANICWSN